jgi:hypothetical protein
MAEAKTRPTKESVPAFIAAQPDPETRRDCATLVRMMARVIGEKAVMWGPAIVGFGLYRYVYASGQTGDWPLAAFSPRKQNLTVYVSSGFDGYAALVRKLGKVKTSKACLYVKSLADVDLGVLEELVAASAEHMRKLYPMTKPGPAAARKKPAKTAAAKPKAATRKAAPKRAKR